MLAELEHDAASAYPGLKLFKKDGAMYAGLREFLGAWVVVSTRIYLAQLLRDPLYS